MDSGHNQALADAQCENIAAWEIFSDRAANGIKNYISICHGGFDEDQVKTLEACFRLGYKNPINEEWRRCINVGFPDHRCCGSVEAWEMFRPAVKGLFEDYKRLIGEYGGGGTLNYCDRIERPNLFEYSPNPDAPNHFHPHADCWNSDSATRQVSVIVYLNDVEKGGETVFPLWDLAIRPTRGTVLMFPSNFAFIHRADPPISGPKLIAVTWLHFGSNPTNYFTYPL